MRFLFTCIPGLGHFNPMIPLANALKKVGHSVAFATAPAFADAVAGADMEFIPVGLDWDERRLLETVPELRAVSKIYRGEWIMNNLFLDRSPRRMIPDLLALIPSWRPDMIIAGSFDYGGPLAAEISGLPYANGNYAIRWHPWVLKHAVGRSMARLRRENGLPADPELTAFGRYIDLCFAPPFWSFEDALLRPGLTRLVRAKVLSRDLPMRQRIWGLRAIIAQRLFSRSLRLRPEQAAIGATTYFIGEEGDPTQEHSPPPAWLEKMPRQPTILVSLGTVLSAEYPDIFDKILSGLAKEPVNLIMTMGGSDDPARFGPQPPNVRIVRFIPQHELRQLLPHIDLYVNHAGHGSVMEALLHGIPLVLLPLVSDAPMNTQMSLSNGVTAELPPEVWGLSPKGLPVIRADMLTPEIIRDAAMHTLRNPQYRNVARRMQRILAERPGLDTAVKLLENVVSAQ